MPWTHVQRDWVDQTYLCWDKLVDNFLFRAWNETAMPMPTTTNPSVKTATSTITTTKMPSWSKASWAATRSTRRRRTASDQSRRSRRSRRSTALRRPTWTLIRRLLCLHADLIGNTVCRLSTAHGSAFKSNRYQGHLGVLILERTRGGTSLC